MIAASVFAATPAVRASRAAATRSTITRNGITMWRFETVTPVVGLFLDHGGGWRLHTGEGERGFRGYASREFDRWTVRAWCASGAFAFHRRNYKTEAGAARALARVALQIRE
jgi:hypothetical protein